MKGREMKEKQTNKKLILGLIALVAVIAALAIGYKLLKPAPTQGAKAVKITVVSADESEQEYKVQTDAEYLKEVMDEADGLEYDGQDSEYGVMVNVVNGEEASFEENGAFWAFHVNGEFCNYGIGEQPIEDGDEFEIIYTIGE